MAKITYRDCPVNNTGKQEKVYLGGKLVGYIYCQLRADTAEYFYEPLGSKLHGAILPSLRAVHRSLES